MTNPAHPGPYGASAESDPVLQDILQASFPGCVQNPNSEFMRKYVLIRLAFKEAQAAGNAVEMRKYIGALNWLSARIELVHRTNAWNEVLTRMRQHAQETGNQEAVRHLDRWLAFEESGLLAGSMPGTGWYEDQYGFSLPPEHTASTSSEQMARQFFDSVAHAAPAADHAPAQAPAEGAGAEGHADAASVLVQASGRCEDEIGQLAAQLDAAQRAGDSTEVARIQLEIQKRQGQMQVLAATLAGLAHHQSEICKTLGRV